MKPFREWVTIQFRSAKIFSKRQIPYLILVSFLLCFFVIFFFNSIVISIYPGELGVLWRRLGSGTQIDTVYREGVHMILPFNKMYIYDVRKQQFTDSINVLTVDGLTVGVKYS